MYDIKITTDNFDVMRLTCIKNFTIDTKFLLVEKDENNSSYFNMDKIFSVLVRRKNENK